MLDLFFIFLLFGQKQAKLRGYNAPRDQPYVPYGVPENVLPVIEGLKNKIEHSCELHPDTQKTI